jgi:phosphoribosylanthranilate isomerase
MFRIKICGITNIDDARIAVDAGADAVGLNFFSKSRRFVDRESALQIAAAIPAGVTKVGVFVNHDPADIAAAVECIGLDAVQLHGDEPPSLMAKLPKDVQVIRAHRWGQAGLSPLGTYLQESRAGGRMPDAVLADAAAGADFGGSGELADWELIQRQRDMLSALPLILAGGLTPDNVAAAIAAVRPHGVDVASGVERQPGRKDRALVARFIAAACDAFARFDPLSA